MFFPSSSPNDAVQAVKHSCTESDNNEESVTAARNERCKTKVLGCIWELKTDCSYSHMFAQPDYIVSASVIELFRDLSGHN